MLKKVLFILMLLPALGLADIPRGERLVHRLWRDMQARNIVKIKEYTSKEFQAFGFLIPNEGFIIGIIKPALLVGIVPLNRFQELDQIKQTNIQTYNLHQIKATEGEDIIVVTYIADVTELIQYQPFHVSSPQMSVWKRFGDQWKWVSQAALVVPTPGIAR